MPFNTLMLTCLTLGTGFTESGGGVSMDRQSDEIALFFAIDDQSNSIGRDRDIGKFLRA